MKIRTTILLLMVTALLTFSLSSLLAQPKVETTEPKQKSWSHIQVFTFSTANTAHGLQRITGFFDTQTGKLYHYDNRFLFMKIQQIDELGAPMKKVVINKNKLTEKTER